MSCNFIGALIGACQVAATPSPRPTYDHARSPVAYVNGKPVKLKNSGTLLDAPLCDYDTSQFERITINRPAQNFIDERVGGPPQLNGRSCRLPVYRDPRF